MSDKDWTHKSFSLKRNTLRAMQYAIKEEKKTNPHASYNSLISDMLKQRVLLQQQRGKTKESKSLIELLLDDSDPLTYQF